MKRCIQSKKTTRCRRSRKISLTFDPNMCGEGATDNVTLVVKIQKADLNPAHSSREQHSVV